MKKIRIPLITLIVIYALVIIFITITIYAPDLVRNKYLAISENFPINVSTVFTGILGLATLGLAYATFEMIISRKEQEKRDRKERLLNEIIEWAVDVSKCGIEKGYPDISNLIDLHAVWLKISNNIGDIILCFKEMRGKNQYISEIVKALDQDLKDASNILIDDFEKHTNLLSLC